jgi:predicted membrane protein
MQEINNNDSPHFRNSRIGSGLILLAAGLLLLASKLGAPIPGWIFTWPMILILVGIVSGVKNNFQNPGAFILIILGFIFLMDQSFQFMELRRFTVPFILIAVGIVFVLRPHRLRGRFSSCSRSKYNDPVSPSNTSGTTSANDDILGEHIDLHAVFGGVKKKIVSKNFKGGRIVSFMGGADISLMQADIQQPVIIEIHNLFAGTKIIIPSNWYLKNEISAIFGGVEDKRPLQSASPDENKVLILRGSCVFGGIDISAY